MTTAINYQTLSQELNTTAKRVETILSTLFGDFEATAEQVKPHVEAVLKLVKSNGLTVVDACNHYRLEVQKQQQQQSGKTAAKPGDKTGQGSVGALLEQDRKATKALSQKRYAAIIRESNTLLANWLTNGLPDDELSTELEDSIFDSSDAVLDALTEAIDITGEYSYPQALKPSTPSIAALLLPSQHAPTNGNGQNSNGKHSK